MEFFKQCTTCSLKAFTESDLELFVKDKKSEYGRSTECKKCYNKRKIKEKQKRQDQKQLIAIKYLGSKCINCNLEATQNNMVVFDFHHIDKITKNDSISNMLADGRPLKVLMEEVSKCALLCSNCHRLHHKKYGY